MTNVQTTTIPDEAPNCYVAATRLKRIVYGMSSQKHKVIFQ